jgi:hypothetical protein
MQGGGSNRILIGDPALRPFGAVNGTAEVVEAERTPAGVRVTVERDDGWQPRAWDMFGGTPDRDYRVLAHVDFGAVGLQGRADFAASVTAKDPQGAPLPYAMRRLAIEDHGRPPLPASAGQRSPRRSRTQGVHGRVRGDREVDAGTVDGNRRQGAVD